MTIPSEDLSLPKSIGEGLQLRCSTVKNAEAITAFMGKYLFQADQPDL